MGRFVKVLGYAQRLFWLLELLVNPNDAAAALLNHPRVARWIEKQSEEDQRKLREAAPLVVTAMLESLG